MKNAVMMLNEIFPPPGSPQYKILSMSGSQNNPTFEMSCTVLDQAFVGSGRSKKEAKLEASQRALEKLYGKDFTKGRETSNGDAKTSKVASSQEINLERVDAWMEVEGKNPVSILNELYPGVIFNLVSADGPSHAPQFCVTATLANMTLEGRGNSKKEAKLQASKALLVHIHKVGFDPMTEASTTSNNENVQVKVWIYFANYIFCFYRRMWLLMGRAVPTRWEPWSRLDVDMKKGFKVQSFKKGKSWQSFHLLPLPPHTHHHIFTLSLHHTHTNQDTEN